jgi:nitrite reductase/ring-hydroxylating ferredoxin subunit
MGEFHMIPLKINNDNHMKRRNFLKRIILGIVSLEAGYLIFDAFKKSSKKTADKNLFVAGRIDAFEKNKMYPFNSGKFYLSVFKNGGMLAISIKCTHLGCIVQPNNNDGFLCPCHASAFDKHGEVISPPATRALDIFPIIIADGKILVDTSKPIKRKGFKKSQLTFV